MVKLIKKNDLSKPSGDKNLGSAPGIYYYNRLTIMQEGISADTSFSKVKYKQLYGVSV